MGGHLVRCVSLGHPKIFFVQQINVMVADILSHAPLNIEFIWMFSENNWETWLHLVQRLMGVSLSDYIQITFSGNWLLRKFFWSNLYTRNL
jgi:hypothetical protein